VSKILAVVATRLSTQIALIENTGGYRIKGWQTRGWSAFADHDG
jgi:hypothetical protein